MRRRIPIFALAALSAVNVFAGQAQPVFKSTVEVIPVDVTVVDAKGAPVSDLTADDFTVRIDGKPRKVLSARFHGTSEQATPAVTVAPGSPPPPAPSFVDNTRSPAGRAVVFVVDLESIQPGQEKLMLDTAGRLSGALGPYDAVGLLPIPGKSIDLTRDHAAVRKALETLRGASRPYWWQGRYITVAEARAFDLNDQRTIGEVIERECSRMEPECPREIRRQAGEILLAARARIANVLGTLASLVRALSRVEAPKTVVFISGGVPFEQESLTYFRDLQRAIAESGTLLYVIQVNQTDIDVSQLGRAGSGQFQAPDLMAGLSMAAGFGAAPLMTPVGTAAGVFDRLKVELGNLYQLGVESVPEDGDGKAHDIRVDVRRPGLDVRSRREMVVASKAPSIIQRLVAMMAQPVDTPDLPIVVSKYTVRGEASDSLKVVVFAEIARGTTINPPVQYAATFLDAQRRPVFETNGYAETLPNATVARAILAAQIPPGRYRVRMAAVDGTGRGGTVELPVTIGLRTAGGVIFSDLLLGTTTDVFRPAISYRPGDRISGLVELYAADPQAFANVAVHLEVRPEQRDEVLGRQPAALLKTDLDRRWLAEAGLAIPSLPAGPYIVSAIVSVGGQPVGKVSRQIEVRP